MIKEVMFDYGGVIGTLPRQNLVESIAKNFGLEKKKCQQVIAMYVRGVQTRQLPDGFWEDISSALGITRHNVLKDLWISHIEKDSEINEDVVSLIKDLRQRSYHLCLLSNTTGLYKYSPHEKRIDQLFHHKVRSCNVGFRKPEREIYLLALHITCTKPEDCVLVDDETRNLLYPQSIGMNTILFESSEQLKGVLEDLMGR
ncbi:MAG: hypothetical protein XD98_0353 [Microgenomates bacterium 39_6]|nr:MAG: hypothetical protein XD98_0353 [Microgenomates bacterium 39_6]